MSISPRTPEGSPNRCPVCGSDIKVEPSDPADDEPCPHCGHLLWFTWENDGGVQVIKPTCVILQSNDLNNFIAKASEKRWVRFVLDLSDVQYMPSAVIASLINLNKKLADVGGGLKLKNIHPNLLEFFRITRLDRWFNVDG